ncbi:MAG: DUF58 domain-containing protein [Candidatus Sericytochromatia bacterium]|nr:DUF58 domain-containing protein [Candidatus Sericytochromatia bacterium]
MTIRPWDFPGPLPPLPEWRQWRAHLQRQGAALAGSYRRHAQPEGQTLRQFRPYQPGDDPRRLHWAASARLAEPIVRELEDERNYPVWTLLDTSGAMFWGSHARRKIDVAAEIALSLGHCVIQAGDRWGFAWGGKRLEQSRSPRPSQDTWRRGWSDFAGVRPPDGSGNLPHVLEGFRRQLKGRSLVVLLSDFPEGDWTRFLARITRQSDLVTLQLVDPLDRRLPATGLTALVDPETGLSGVYRISPAAALRAAKLSAQWRAEVASRCHSVGAAHAVIHTDQPWLPVVQRVLQQRVAR